MSNIISNFLKKRTLKQLSGIIKDINLAEQTLDLQKFSPKEYTKQFKEQIKNKTKTLDDILPIAFALCRKVSEDVLNMRHFDVQLIGGITLHKGSIAEMRTGEGKTLAATLPSYLNALSGQQVHIVTVNDYLAKRDSELMSPLYNALGITCGYLQTTMTPEEKTEAYSNEIVYATSNELAFDYLRDNMVTQKEEVKQKGLSYAIIDEIDSILIDEARTPLIISGMADVNEDIPTFMNSIVPNFSVYFWNVNKDKDDDEHKIQADVIIDEKNKSARLTENGHVHLEKILLDAEVIFNHSELYSFQNQYLVGACLTAFKANFLYNKGIDYLLFEDKIVLINQSTGRIEKDKRWSNGLHQAVEAKEGVKINADNKTLATVSLQNFFRMYNKLSGMSGTATSESEEFEDIYQMGVITIPSNKPVLRKDLDDVIFATENLKFDAIIEDIQSNVAKQRPVLVGTSSVEESDKISFLLTEKNIPHQLLNAKHHMKEADIIADAGIPSNVTIATNMAGRGTDIILGGCLKDWIKRIQFNSECAEHYQEEINNLTEIWKKNHEAVIKAGGLHVIGTTRNDSRRIDDQLIGRSGRQGDPGSSKFYLSFDDKLMRLFNNGGLVSKFKELMAKDKEGLSHKILNRAIEKSQGQIASQSSNARKDLLKFDEVVNLQRKSIYKMRNNILYSNAWESVFFVSDIVLNDIFEKYIPNKELFETWNFSGLEDSLKEIFNIKVEIKSALEEEKINEDEAIKLISNLISSKYKKWDAEIPLNFKNEMTRDLFLRTLDNNWQLQLDELDQLKMGIHLRTFAQKDPLQEYSREAFTMFEDMLSDIRAQFISSCHLAFPDLITEWEKAKDAFIHSTINSENTDNKDDHDLINIETVKE